MGKTVVQQIVDAWKSTGQVGFEMWFSENHRRLIEDEKQQILDAWQDGYITGLEGWEPEKIEYYNETFTDKKQQQ